MADLISVTTIKDRKSFLALNKHSKRFIVSNFVLLYSPNEQLAEGHSRIGYTVTKKIGNAVTRNRTKRRLREVVRQVALLHMKPQYDYVLIARHNAPNCEFAALLKDMTFAFSKIKG